MNDTANLKLRELPYKTPKAWLCKPVTGGEHWIPYSVIHSFNPGSMNVAVEVWFLTKNNIKFKL